MAKSVKNYVLNSFPPFRTHWFSSKNLQKTFGLFFFAIYGPVTLITECCFRAKGLIHFLKHVHCSKIMFKIVCFHLTIIICYYLFKKEINKCLTFHKLQLNFDHSKSWGPFLQFQITRSATFCTSVDSDL